jgi:hypothetical protein
MNVNVNVKRKFKINGEEYNSIEEMPPDIRKAFEKAMASQAGTDTLAKTQTKIIFNGNEYKNIEEMPPNIRQLYEEVLKAAETGNAPERIITASDIHDMLTGRKNYKINSIGDMIKQVKIEPTAFSSRILIVGFMVIALIILLYFMFQGK